MNSKERVTAAVNHKNHDRPPLFVTLTPQVAKLLSDYVGIAYEEPVDSLLSTRISHTRLLTELGNDCIGIAASPPDGKPTKVNQEGLITNEYGMVFRNAGLYNEFHSFPLAAAESVADIESYELFDPRDETRFAFSIEQVKQYGKNYAVVGDLETSIFETAWYLTGFEKLLGDLLTGPPYLDALLDKIMFLNLETGKRLIELGADIIWAGDDFGMQTGMVMDPETWRRIFKPRIRYMFDEFRKVNSNIKIAWHTCGSVLPIIPDFIEAGLDILNPLQPKAYGMEPEYLVKNYGKDLVFFGGIDIQDLMPAGPTQKIKDEINRRIEIFGKYNGYIAAPAHNIQPDTPVEHIIALFETVKNFRY